MSATDEIPGRIAYINAQIIDPATDTDMPGYLCTDGEKIIDVGTGLFNDDFPKDMEVIDCNGSCLAPGLVDIRVQTGEPGQEHKETLATAGRAAVSGGITSMICLPNTDPIIDDMSTLEFIARRARLHGLAKVYCYGAVTKGLEGSVPVSYTHLTLPTNREE